MAWTRANSIPIITGIPRPPKGSGGGSSPPINDPTKKDEDNDGSGGSQSQEQQDKNKKDSKEGTGSGKGGKEGQEKDSPSKEGAGAKGKKGDKEGKGAASGTSPNTVSVYGDSPGGDSHIYEEGPTYTEPIPEDARRQGKTTESGSMGPGSANREEGIQPSKTMTEDELRDYLKRLRDEARKHVPNEGGSGRGSGLDAWFRNAVTNLDKPEVDWKKTLKRFWDSIREVYDPSRDYKNPPFKIAGSSARDIEIYIPRGKYVRENVASIVVAVDTSGSIGDEELRKCISEVFGMLNIGGFNSIVRVLLWHTSVYFDSGPISSIDKGAQAQTLANIRKAAASGGTTISCVAEYIDKNAKAWSQKKVLPRGIVYFTDGEVESGRFALPKIFGENKNKYLFFIIGLSGGSAKIIQNRGFVLGKNIFILANARVLRE